MWPSDNTALCRFSCVRVCFAHGKLITPFRDHDAKVQHFGWTEDNNGTSMIAFANTIVDWFGFCCRNCSLVGWLIIVRTCLAFDTAGHWNYYGISQSRLVSFKMAAEWVLAQLVGLVDFLLFHGVGLGCGFFKILAPATYVSIRCRPPMLFEAILLECHVECKTIPSQCMVILLAQNKNF